MHIGSELKQTNLVFINGRCDMGGVSRAFRRVTRGLRKGLGEVFEEVVEKPVKKVATETFDTVAGVNKQERRAMLYGEMPEVTPEVTPEVVPDDETLIASRGRGTRRTKRTGAAGTIMEDYGALSISPKKKAVERA